MALTPLDIQNVRFRKGLSGYKASDVETFREIILKEYEALYKENIEIKDRLSRAEDQIAKYKAIETTLNNTLVMAQQQAEDLKRNAEKAAELILDEAKIKAYKKIKDAETRVKDIHGYYEDFIRKVEEFKVKYRAVLLAQLDLLPTIDEAEIIRPEEVIGKLKREKPAGLEAFKQEEKERVITQIPVDQGTSAKAELSTTAEVEVPQPVLYSPAVPAAVTEPELPAPITETVPVTAEVPMKIPFWKKLLPPKKEKTQTAQPGNQADAFQQVMDQPTQGEKIPFWKKILPKKR